MGAAAAHALDLAAGGGGKENKANKDGSVHDIDIAQLTGRLAANLGGGA